MFTPSVMLFSPPAPLVFPSTHHHIRPSHPPRILLVLRHRIDGFPLYPLLAGLIRPLLDPDARTSRIARHGCFAGAFAFGVAGGVGGAFAVFCVWNGSSQTRRWIGWDRFREEMVSQEARARYALWASCFMNLADAAWPLGVLLIVWIGVL